MKQYLLLGLALLACLSFAFALESPVRSASELDYPPFSIITETGEAGGFSVELLKAALHAKGMDVAFYVAPWGQIKQDLADGKIQVLPLVARTPEREQVYDFTKPYLTMFGAIFVREGDNRIKSVTDLQGKETLVMKGDVAEEYARKAGVSQNIIATDSYEEAFRLLSSGRHDAIIANNLIGDQIIAKNGIKNVVRVDYRIDEFRQDFTFAVREGDAELLGVLDEGLEIINVDGRFDRLYKKWFAREKNENSSLRIPGLIAAVAFFLAVVYLIARKAKIIRYLRRDGA